MRDPATVLASTRKRYDKGWRTWLADAPAEGFSFPLGAPNATTAARETETVARWLRTWRRWAAQHAAVSLRPARIATAIGPQQLFTHLDVPSVEALASLASDTRDHWQKSSRRYPVLRDLAASEHRLKPQLKQIMDLDDYDFDLLLRAATWFLENPRSGLTLRQVPVIGMHTKWLAKHRRLVLALLPERPQTTEQMRLSEDDDLEPQDLDALGLNPLPNHVDIILADPRDRLHGLRHFRAPLDEIAALPITPAKVLVVENKESALPIPDTEGLVVVHSLGNFLDVLSALPWIASAQTWYWGDLDRAGFTLLSRARSRIPSITSILMDQPTLNLHADLAVDDPTKKVDLPEPTLTSAEAATLTRLSSTTPPRRLEQERLPWSYAATAFGVVGLIQGQ